MKCPVCKLELHGGKSGNGLYYFFCPTKSKKHLFEIGPYKTEKQILKVMKKIEGE
jgi:hypothetical protein